MPKKRKNKLWLKVAIASLAISVPVAVTIFKFSCPNSNVKVQIGGQTTQQSSSGYNSTNVSGNGTVNINNSSSPLPVRDFNEDMDTGHKMYDRVRGPLDPPWESLNAKEKMDFIKQAATYNDSQFNSLKSIINNSISNSAGSK